MIWYTCGMDIALIVIGLIVVAVLVVWIYTWVADPKNVQDEERGDVASMSPRELERERFDARIKEEERKADEIDFYSRAEETDQ